MAIAKDYAKRWADDGLFFHNPTREEPTIRELMEYGYGPFAGDHPNEIPDAEQATVACLIRRIECTRNGRWRES